MPHGSEEFVWSPDTPAVAITCLLGYLLVVFGRYRREHADDRERGYRKWWQPAWLTSINR